jgi:hypothetical protein
MKRRDSAKIWHRSVKGGFARYPIGPSNGVSKGRNLRLCAKGYALLVFRQFYVNKGVCADDLELGPRQHTIDGLKNSAYLFG